MDFGAVSWQQFAMVAGAHGLALISPGPDFFLVVRSAMVSGMRQASGVCLGIALGNGVYIALALAGLVASNRIHGLFTLLQWAGCGYLWWLGWQCMKARGALTLPQADAASTPAHSGWLAQVGTGFLSAILNPKNGLFYASLFAVLTVRHTPMSVQVAYGAWMSAAVLVWDLAVAVAAGHPAVVRYFARSVRHIERMTGVVLWAMAAAIALNAAGR